MDQDKIRLMRGASYLLPDPGGEVVRELLDEIERLQNGVPEAPEPGGLLRLFNADTGMYYVQGRGFVAECRRKAALLDSAKRAAVRFSYAGSIVDEDPANDGKTHCGCGACEPKEEA